MIKVINLENDFLESRKRASQINLETSRISLEVGCGVGVGWVRGWVGVGNDLGDAMIPFSRSRFEIPVLEIPLFEISI